LIQNKDKNIFETLGILSILNSTQELDFDPSNLLFPTTNGVVKEQIRIGNILYAIGDYSFMGYPAERYAEINPNDGSLIRRNMPLVSGVSLNRILKDNLGRTYLIGNFTAVDGVSRSNFARLNADGTLSSFAPSFNGAIRFGLLLSNNKLLLSGAFTTVDSTSTTFGIVAIDLNTDTIDTAWVKTLSTANSVNAMLEKNSNVYLGGSFTTIDGNVRNGLVKLNLTGTVDTTWTISIAGTPLSINSLATNTDGTRLFIGGVFSTVGVTSKPHLASIDITSSPTLDTNFESNFTFSTTATAISKIISDGTLSDGNLYICGRFATLSGIPAVAKLKQSTGVVDREYRLPQVNSSLLVNECLLNGNDMYIAAGISISNTMYTRSVLLKYNHYIRDFDYGFNPFPSTNVNGITLYENVLYVAGAFQYIGGLFRKDIAGINLVNGDITETKIEFPAGGNLNSAASFDNNLILGGSFYRAGYAYNRNLTKYDPRNNEVITNFNPDIDGEVYHVMNVEGDLLISGNFQTVNSNPRSGFAKLNSTFGSLDPYFKNFPEGNVYSCVLYKGDYLCAGSFSKVSGVNCPNLCLFDRGTGKPKSSNFKYTGGIYKLIKNSDRIHILGNLTSWEDTQVAGLVTVSSENLSQIISTEIPVNGLPHDIVSKNNRTVVGGDFTASNQVPLYGLTAYTLGSNTVRSEGNPYQNRDIFSIQAIGKNTFSVGGNYSTLNGKTQFGLGLVQFSD